MSSWKIDPSTGDYIMDKGRPVPSDSLTIPAYYRLKIQRTRWLYAPNDKYGSDLYTLQKNTGIASQNMMQTALQPIVDDGRALDVSVNFDETASTGRNDQAIQVALTNSENVPEVLNLPPVGD